VGNAEAITSVSEVEPASGSEASQILGLLEASFDRYAEQLPDTSEIAAAIADQNVLVVRDGARIAGVLYFERTGFTACVRYWLVGPAYQNRKLGARLMRSFFGRCSGVTRSLLWVLADNDNAIKRYGHYGFKPDGLADLTMIRRAR
jgi:GNAT superfamily N-acetyltransferase